MDEDDRCGAWKAFEAASRDDPNSPSLSHLEVQLLVAQNEPERARERARYWIRRFEKRGRTEYEGIITFLRDFAEDPSGALANVTIDGGGGAGAALREWLHSVAGRPVPQYQLAAADDFVGDDVMEPSERLSDQLRRMGLSGLDPAQLRERLSRAVDEAGAEGDALPDPEPALEHAHTIRPPRSLVRMESAWREVFALDKPFCADLQHGRDAAALALCDRFPGDMLAEIAFGRVLALYRLGRVEEAIDSLRGAVERHPPLARILTAKRAPRINLDPSGYILGSDEEASGYRETMRNT